MREVANTTAHAAIDRASWLQRAHSAGIRLAMAGASAVAGCTLIAYATGGMAPVLYVISVAAFALAAWWACQAARFAIGAHAVPAELRLQKFFPENPAQAANLPAEPFDLSTEAQES